jgi:hypothetical protein
VDCAASDEVVEHLHALGLEVAHAVAGDGEEVEVELLDTVAKVVVLLLLSFRSGRAELLSRIFEVGGEELVLDSVVNEGLLRGEADDTVGEDLIRSVSCFEGFAGLAVVVFALMALVGG